MTWWFLIYLLISCRSAAAAAVAAVVDGGGGTGGATAYCRVCLPRGKHRQSRGRAGAEQGQRCMLVTPTAAQLQPMELPVQSSVGSTLLVPVVQVVQWYLR
jgi:hypothetical protein